MREIKFRGRVPDKGWLYGDLRHIGNNLIYIVDKFGHGSNVNPNTVEQFTGLKDSEGREIYEGDIVEAKLKDKSFVKRFHMDETVTGEISFDGAWGLGEWDALWRLPRYYDLTVIGNIHDNPELLEDHA